MERTFAPGSRGGGSTFYRVDAADVQERGVALIAGDRGGAEESSLAEAIDLARRTGPVATLPPEAPVRSRRREERRRRSFTLSPVGDRVGTRAVSVRSGRQCRRRSINSCIFVGLGRRDIDSRALLDVFGGVRQPPVLVHGGVGRGAGAADEEGEKRHGNGERDGPAERHDEPRSWGGGGLPVELGFAAKTHACVSWRCLVGRPALVETVTSPRGCERRDREKMPSSPWTPRPASTREGRRPTSRA
jgi:hypothetical protein